MIYYPILSFLLLLPIIFIIILKPKQGNLPPGPKPWPIIGNLNLLGNKPHLSITNLSKIYGPLMLLKLGSVTTIVISSSKVAREMFMYHDLALSSRHVPSGGKVGNHDKLSIGWLPVGPAWRNLRKISTLHLFTNKRLDASKDIRERKVGELVEFVTKCSERGQRVDISQLVFTTTINVLSNTLFSIDLAYYDEESSDKRGFKACLWEFWEVAGKPNVSDVFPLVERFDLQGLSKKIGVCFDKIKGLFGDIIEERLSDHTCGTKGDVLDHLLQLVRNNELRIDSLKHLFFDLFIAGTDTSTTTTEWAMTELLRHPQKMAKVQAEINQVKGKNGLVRELDIKKLLYLEAVVKETLRLHPPTPFLLPHKAEKDVQLCSYLVPKDAQIWVNVWWIGRDPNVWQDPESFSPERFLDANNVDVKGRNFDFIPFGEGRRMCPGMPLAYRMIQLILANLVCSFNWKMGDGVNNEDIDVEEKFGIQLQRAKPLQIIPLSS